MRSIRRAAPVLLLAISALVPLVPVNAAPTPPAGVLAFITKSGALDLVGVLGDGSIAQGPKQIAPVTKVAAPSFVQVSDLVVSADQQWMAWTEQIFKPNKRYGKEETGSRVVVRHNYNGAITSVRANLYPLGFAGTTLVAIGGYADRLVMKPTPHFVRIPDGNAYAVATYPKGIVDVKSVGSLDSDVDHEQLRLTSFGGHHTVLHTYVVGTSYRNVTANIDAVSPNGQHLLVERGNHQDFDGLGPSSLFDEYTLSAGFPRHQLGHYGTDGAKWRLQTAAFVGKSNQVWLAEHDYGKTVHGAVVRYVDGVWKLVQADAITVAGNPQGYAIVQPGKWVLQKNSPDGEYDPVPTADAGLWLNGSKVGTVAIQGSEFVWVNGVFSGSGTSTTIL